MEKKEIERRLRKLEKENRELKKLVKNNVSRDQVSKDISRRDFLKKIGAGTVGLGALGLASASGLKLTKSSITGISDFGGSGSIAGVSSINTDSLYPTQDVEAENEITSVMTKGVSTSGKKIVEGSDFDRPNRAFFLFIVGEDQNDRSGSFFSDIVNYTSYGGSPTVVTGSGYSESSRTYSRNGNSLELSMASGTYDVSVTAIRVNFR